MAWDLVVQGAGIDDRQIDTLAKLCRASRHRRLGPGAARLDHADPHAGIEAVCAELNLDHAFVPAQARLTDFGLVAMDMDSTLITMECVDELADIAGMRNEVAAITHSAMRGEINFAESLARRVALLSGLDASALQRVYDERLRMAPGARRLLEALNRIGIRTLLVSGGFSYFTSRLRDELGFDYAAANEPEIEGGKFTGRLIGDVVDAPAKARILRATCADLGLAAERVIAIGDGANDLAMMEIAGVSIAYHAKPLVRRRATYSFVHVGLDGLLNLYP